MVFHRQPSTANLGVVDRLAAMILPVMLAYSVPADAQPTYQELTPEELGLLERQATGWLLELEERQRPLARALTAAEKAAFAGYFSAELLDRARLREVAGIDNPDFYRKFFSERGNSMFW